MAITLHRARAIRGRLAVPGDKSIAHRALILGALARGRQVVTGLPNSADLTSTIDCLKSLGCSVSRTGPEQLEIAAGTVPATVTLDAGNSGTTARLLAGVMAAQPVDVTITGDTSLQRRPMTRIAEPLAMMGAEIFPSPTGTLPLRITGRNLHGIDHQPRVASAQVKSAILLAGLQATGQTVIQEKHPTRDHTELLLQAMKVPVQRDGNRISITGPVSPQGVAVDVPGDFSAAAFFLAAVTLVPGSHLVLPAVGVNPTRTGLLTVLEEMGASITRVPVPSRSARLPAEPVADLSIRSSNLRGVEVGGDMIPRLIDELPVLAVLATQAEGITRVRDAGELRVKESDRIATLVANLSRLGANITEETDGFTVQGPCRLRGAAVSTCGDHRIGMALAVAALVADGSTCLAEAEAVRTSYPGFFADLEQVQN